jgi:alkaline phosphatase
MTVKSPHFERFLGPVLLSSLFFLSGCIAEKAMTGKSGDSPTQNTSKEIAKSEDKIATAGNIGSPSTPKNIIIFIGDGMGISTITAGRIFDGQSKGKKGEEHELAFDSFENVALIKTYNTNAQVPDSAGTATAILSGYKTNIGAINVRPDEDVKKMVLNSCVLKREPPNLTQRAKKAGRAVGIVSTARITHATPAAMYGTAVDRGWEMDSEVDERASKFRCMGLAGQLLQSNVDITLGGGRSKFKEAQISDWSGKADRTFVSSAEELRSAPKAHDILGLFSPSHMSYEADRDNSQEPSLAEMTEFTIEALGDRGKGYVMMGEAGRVDHAHHGTNAFRALRDMQALNEAVETAKQKTGDDTLIIVTADHSHVFTMAGYPVRGNPILGLVRNPDPIGGGAAKDYAKASDGKPYTTLGYHNGPNVRKADSPALSDNAVQSIDYQQQTAVHLDSETHAGEDVAIFATGPGADRFKGVMEQDEIGQILAALLEPTE